MQSLLLNNKTNVFLLIEHALRGNVNDKFRIMFIPAEWIPRKKTTKTAFSVQPVHDKEFLLVSGRWIYFKPSQM